MQRTTLILRYGIGPVRPRSGREAAQLLDVSRSRVRLLEHGGVRSLAGFGHGPACAGTGIARITLVAVFELLQNTSTTGGQGLPALLDAGVRLANATSVTLGGEGEGAVEGAVEGARESGGDRRNASPEREGDGPVSSAGPSLGVPFGDTDAAFDNPLFLFLLASVVACLAYAAREVRRALR